MKNPLYFITFFCALFFSKATAQETLNTQNIQGTVVDNLTQQPVAGTIVELLNFYPVKQTHTNAEGKFLLSDIPLGKHQLLLTHDKYDYLIVPEINVTSAKEVILNLALEEIQDSISEILVKANTKKTTKDQPNNAMVLTGIRSFTIDEVRRYSGAKNDPSRLAANFAGVNVTNDFENGLIIRGNSPLNVLWQLEGMPIPSPNHFSLAGYINGVSPMLNTNLMKNSDFMNGAFSAQYGNVTGGVFDIGLRSGNSNLYEGLVQFGYTGLEAGFEGPLSIKNGSSFVIGYRYSIYDLLSLTGIDYGTSLIPNNQDLSFKIDFGKTKIGTFSLFGMGGLGNINVEYGSLDDSTDIANVIGRNVKFAKQIAVLGLNHQINFSKNTFWKSTLGGTFNRENYTEDTSNLGKPVILLQNDNTVWNGNFSSYINHQFNFNLTLRTGVILSYYNINTQFKDDLFNTGFRNEEGNTLLSQVYIQSLIRIGNKLKINVGVNGQHLSLNNSYGIGPRFALSWQLLNSHKLSLAYGWHHQIQPLRIYFNQKQDSTGQWQNVNKHLGFTQAHHIIAAYDWLIANNWRLKLEGYYQLYTNIPVTTYASAFSAINMGQEYELLTLIDLENKGLARNYGAELTLEKFFSKGYYGLLTASYINSKYRGSDLVWRNTPYNNSYIFNFLVGKEFKIGKRKQNAITIDLNFVYAGGNPYTPINLEASNSFGYEVREWDNAYSLKNKDYWRVDLKIGAYFNNKRKRISHRIFLDLVNVANQQNTFLHQYNAVTKGIVEIKQMGIFPDLTYRLTFGFKPKS